MNESWTKKINDDVEKIEAEIAKLPQWAQGKITSHLTWFHAHPVWTMMIGFGSGAFVMWMWVVL